jgi:hypothetical protein
VADARRKLDFPDLGSKSRHLSAGKVVEELNPISVAQQPGFRAEMLRRVPARNYVYAGFGVAGRQGVSERVPLDILSIILEAESARRQVFGSGLLFLVADTHALRTGDYDPNIVMRAAERRREIIFRACEALSVPDYTVVLASEIENDGFYTELVKAASEAALGDGKYFVLEAADIEFFRLVGGITVKVGWTLASSPKAVGRFDEQAFDKVYQEIFSDGSKLTFLYTRPGRTLNPAKLNAAPYLSFDDSTRIMLERGEDVVAKLTSCTHGGTLKSMLVYLDAILSKWEELSGQALNGSDTAEKVSTLIELFTRGD